jgi:Putative MetA-pathway of phenol degradation
VDPGGANLLGEQEVRRNEFEFAANLLVGLPLDSQLELGLPYNLVDQSFVNKVLGTEVQESSRTGQGLGDFSVGLATTVLRERNWLPDVVVRVNWDTGTGERQNNDVALGAGFQELTGSVSLIKRQDPLVFVGGAFYEWAYDQEDDIDPGNSYGFSIGTFLAASPNTSLSVVLNQSFGDEVEVAGQRIRGSDTVQSILSFGASAILGRNWLLNGAVGVGLTDDSPDYSVSLSLPIRFSTPGL